MFGFVGMVNHLLLCIFCSPCKRMSLACVLTLNLTWHSSSAIHPPGHSLVKDANLQKNVLSGTFVSLFYLNSLWHTAGGMTPGWVLQ